MKAQHLACETTRDSYISRGNENLVELDEEKQSHSLNSAGDIYSEAQNGTEDNK